MTEITKYQHCVEEQEQYIVEAIGILQAQGEMDLEVLQGACYGCYRLSNDLIAEAKDELDLPEFMIPHVNWESLIPDWLASHNSVSVKTSLGIAIIERCDVDEELLDFLEDLKTDGEI